MPLYQIIVTLEAPDDDAADEAAEWVSQELAEESEELGITWTETIYVRIPDRLAPRHGPLDG